MSPPRFHSALLQDLHGLSKILWPRAGPSRRAVDAVRRRAHGHLAPEGDDGLETIGCQRGRNLTQRGTEATTKAGLAAGRSECQCERYYGADMELAWGDAAADDWIDLDVQEDGRDFDWDHVVSDGEDQVDSGDSDDELDDSDVGAEWTNQERREYRAWAAHRIRPRRGGRKVTVPVTNAIWRACRGIYALRKGGTANATWAQVWVPINRATLKGINQAQSLVFSLRLLYLVFVRAVSSMQKDDQDLFRGLNRSGLHNSMLWASWAKLIHASEATATPTKARLAPADLLALHLRHRITEGLRCLKVLDRVINLSSRKFGLHRAAEVNQSKARATFINALESRPRSDHNRIPQSETFHLQALEVTSLCQRIRAWLQAHQTTSDLPPPNSIEPCAPSHGNKNGLDST